MAGRERRCERWYNRNMIRIDGLQKISGARTILDIRELSVPEGETCAIIGPTGSGKGLLLDLLLGKTQPTAGSIRLGPDSSVPGSTGLGIGVLFKEDGLYPRQTSEQNLVFTARLFGLPTSVASEMLSRVGLRDQARTKVEALPPGMARRLAFGRAILHEPAVLILCEPLMRCDENSIAILKKQIVGYAQKAAVLILAESEAHLSDFCDQTYALQQGALVPFSVSETHPPSGIPFKIPVRLEGRVLLLNPADILYADANEGGTLIWTGKGCLPSQFTLTELEQRLARSGFFRAHRSYLVNLQHVREVIPYTRSSYSLILDDPDETSIPLSKSAAAELRELLDF